MLIDQEESLKARSGISGRLISSWLYSWGALTLRTDGMIWPKSISLAFTSSACSSPYLRPKNGGQIFDPYSALKKWPKMHNKHVPLQCIFCQFFNPYSATFWKISFENGKFFQYLPIFDPNSAVAPPLFCQIINFLRLTVHFLSIF